MSDIKLTIEDVQNDTCPACASEDALMDMHTSLEIPDDHQIRPYFYSEIFCTVCNTKWRTFSELELWPHEMIATEEGADE